MTVVGRIVARGKTAGLFVPMYNKKLDGIYEVVDIMDELTIRKVGKSAMSIERFVSLNLEDLFNERECCCMTRDELDSIN